LLARANTEMVRHGTAVLHCQEPFEPVAYRPATRVSVRGALHAFRNCAPIRRGDRLALGPRARKDLPVSYLAGGQPRSGHPLVSSHCHEAALAGGGRARLEAAPTLTSGAASRLRRPYSRGTFVATSFGPDLVVAYGPRLRWAQFLNLAHQRLLNALGGRRASCAHGRHLRGG
jgi:hypothetical protein